MNNSFAQWCRLALLSLLLVPAVALAQQPNSQSILTLGNAVVTGFSGTVTPDPAKVRAAKKPAVDLTFIDPDGPSARIVDVSRPGYVWDGSVFPATKTFNVLAKDVGQVFGIALDDAPQPNIYLAATSVFGLNIVARGRDGQPERRKKGGPGVGWMKGQFGLDLQGGPGAIYKIDGRTGVPALFANVTLDGVPNPAAGLGNLAYDAAHKQLFVSDLYTGMIHRFDLDGKELDRYDHGVTGLGLAKLPSVAFNPANRPNIASNNFDSEKPDTWGLAPAARRVFGLAVHEGRLYYSVVSGPQIWSVGLTREGAFAGDARWELDVPAQAGPLPISDIAFSNKGAMILAQRALVAGAYDYSAFTRPGEPQVFRIWLKGPNDPPSPGRWKLTPEEYAVGFAGNYRNTNGGVALGYGYGQDGAANNNACEFSLWTTGQNLRNAPPLRQRLDPGGALVVHGIQGLPASPVRDVNTPPWLSYSVAYGDRADNPRAAGHLGSVRIFTQPCAAPALYSGPGYPANPPYIVVVGPRDDCIFAGNCPPAVTQFDIGLRKIGERNLNNPHGGYNFTIGARNLGAAIAGPQTITFTDVVPAGMTFTNVTSSNWNCLPVIGPPMPAGATLTCTYTGPFPIAANQALGWVTIVATGGNGPYENCAKLGQTDGNPSNDRACVTVKKDPVGELMVEKVVVSHLQGTQLPNTTYPVNVTCGGATTTLNLVDGIPQTIGNIPYTTNCTVVEPTPPVPPNVCPQGTTGAWTIAYTYSPPAPITISSVTTSVMVTNTFDCKPAGGLSADLGIAKIGERNLNNPHGPYNFTIGVKNLGAAITNATPLTFTDVVPAGMTFTNVTSSNWTCAPMPGAPIPAGGTLTCTYSGPFPIAANQALGWVTIVATGGDGPYENCASLGQPDSNSSNDKACITVKKDAVGELIVVKKVVYNGPLIMPNLTYPVSVTCGSWSKTFNLINNVPQSEGNVPQVSCNVVETLPPAPASACPPNTTATWQPPAVTPSNPFTPSGITTTVTVTNTLDCKPSGGGTNSLTVSKQVINNTVPQLPIPAGTVYAISTSCVSGSSPAQVTPMPLLNNGSQTVNGLALNTVCTISETPPAPPPIIAVSCAAPGTVPVWTVVPPAPVTISGPTNTAVVQNILDCKQPGGPSGYVLVSKIIQNDTNNKSNAYTAALNALVFPVTVSCDGNLTPLNLSYGNQSVVHNVPVGQHCSVQEGTPPPPAPSSTACPGGLVPTWVMPPTYFPTTPQEVHNNAGPALSVTNRLICAQPMPPPPPPPPPPAGCKPPMIPAAVRGQCMCPQGTVQRGGECVKQTVCKAPMVPGAVPGQCVCPAGKRKVGASCVEQIACQSPAKLNSRGTGCDCPRGMTPKGNSCVKQDTKKPSVTPNDVIRVLPGVLGPGGFGGGGGGSKPRDGGGGAGGGSGGYKPPGVR